MNDVFMPDWEVAPIWAQFHTVSENYEGEWWSRCPRLVDWYDMGDGDEIYRWSWEHVEENTEFAINHIGAFNERRYDADWRNSLRVRPQITVVDVEWSGTDDEIVPLTEWRVQP